MSIEIVTDAERTTVMGLHQSICAAGMFVGPLPSGVLAETIGIQPMFGVTASALLAAGPFLARLLPTGSPEHKP
jgi:hypothetical protein